MFRLLKSGVLSLALLASLNAVVMAADPFGKTCGSFNGVVAYSNGTNGYFSNVQNSANGYSTAYKWQCAEFAARYYKLVYGMQVRGGDANSWYTSAKSKGLRSFANGGTTMPAVGDILCSNYSTGHVAIVREVGSNYIKVIQQNWANNSADNSMTLSMTFSGGKHTVAAAGSYRWQGLLRK